MHAAKKILLTIIATIVLAGCSSEGTVGIKYPLLQENELVFDIALLGVWLDDDDGNSNNTAGAVVLPLRNKEYTLIMSDAEIFVAKGYLGRIGGNTFAEIFEIDSSLRRDPSIISRHFLAKVILESDTLTIIPLSVDWFKDMILEDKVTVSYEEKSNEGLLTTKDFFITASTKELREFLLPHISEAFPISDAVRFFRQQ